MIPVSLLHFTNTLVSWCLMSVTAWWACCCPHRFPFFSPLQDILFWTWCAWRWRRLQKQESPWAVTPWGVITPPSQSLQLRSPVSIRRCSPKDRWGSRRLLQYFVSVVILSILLVNLHTPSGFFGAGQLRILQNRSTIINSTSWV